MIPQVFTYDFAGRCLALIDAFEPTARKTTTSGNAGQGPLLTTFVVTMAMPLLIVPIERLGTYKGAAKHDRSLLPTMYKHLSTELDKPFNAVRFRGNGCWSMVLTEGPVSTPEDWGDSVAMAGGLFAEAHRRAIDALNAEEVLNGLRCALAHESVAYLDHQGNFSPGSEAEVIAFFAKKRDGTDAPKVQIYAARQEDFLQFLRDWACFLDEIKGDDAIDPPILVDAA